MYVSRLSLLVATYVSYKKTLVSLEFDESSLEEDGMALRQTLTVSQEMRLSSVWRFNMNTYRNRHTRLMRQNGPYGPGWWTGFSVWISCVFVWPRRFKCWLPPIRFFFFFFLTEVTEACRRVCVQGSFPLTERRKTPRNMTEHKINNEIQKKKSSCCWTVRHCAVEHRNKLSGTQCHFCKSCAYFKTKKKKKKLHKYNKIIGETWKKMPKQKVELQAGRMLNMLSEWQGQRSLVEGMMRKKRVWHDDRPMQNGSEPHFLQTQNRWLFHS